MLNKENLTIEKLLEINKQLEEENKSLKSKLQEKSIIDQNSLSFFDCISAMVSYTTKDLRYKYVNKAYEKNFGLKAENINGRKLVDIIGEKVFSKAKKHINRVLEGEKVSYIERFEYPDNIVKYIEGLLLPDKNVSGEIQGYWAILYDNTEKIVAEEKLRESEKKFRSIYQKTPVMLHSIDKNGLLISVSDYWLEKTGYKREEVIGCKSVDFLTDHSRNEAVNIHLPDFFEKGYAQDVPYQFVKKSGEIMDVLMSAYAVRDDSGAILHSMAVITDITELKRMEEALRKSEARYKTILHTAMDGFFLLDMNGNILETNETYCKMSGYDVNELCMMNISDLEALEGKDEIYSRILKLKKTKNNRFISKHRQRDGNIFDVEISVQYLSFEGGRLIVFIRDITEQKRIESEKDISLRLLQELSIPSDLHKLMNRIAHLLQEWSGCEAIGIRLKEGEDYPYFETLGFSDDFVLAESHLCEVDSEGNMVRDFQGNPVLECMCGNVLHGRFDPGLPFFTINGSFWTNSTTKLLASTSEADRQARTRNRCHGEGFESVALIPLRYGDHTLGLIQFNDSRPGCFDEYQIMLFERLATNLSLGLAHRHTVDELAKSEELFRKAFDSEHIAMAISREKDGVYLKANPGFKKITGYHYDEIINHSSQELGFFTVEERKHLLKQLQGKGYLHNQELWFKKKSGEECAILFSIGKVIIDNEKCMLATMVDITRRKKMERQLKLSEEKYRTIFNNAPLGIFRSTTGGRFIEMNNALSDMLGYKSPEDAMQNIKDIASQVYVKTDERLGVMNNTLNNPGIQKFENVYKRKNGTVFNAFLYLKAVKNESGQTLFLEGMVEDITERKRKVAILKESELKYKNLMEKSPVGIALFLNNRLILSNTKYFEILGYENIKDLKEHEVLSALHPDDIDNYKKQIKELIVNDHASPLNNNYRIVDKDGDIRYISEYLSVFEINQNRYVQSIIQDITEIMIIEEGKKKLASESAYIERKLQLLKQVESELKTIIKRYNYNMDHFYNVLNLFKNEIELDKHWHIFKDNFESIHLGFFEKLTSISPKLTQQDIKHCAFIKLNFETKEIAAMFNVKPTSVQMSRVRLKKKLGLKPEDDLIQFILNI